MIMWVLTPAPGRRQGEVEDLWASLGIDRDYRVVVTTEPDPIERIDGHLVKVDSPELNISKWWTAGLDYIAKNSYGPYNVLLIESDARISRDDLDQLNHVLNNSDAVMAGADWHGTLESGQVHYNTSRGPVPAHLRLPGVCLLVKGELGLRHDPSITFYFADDDFEWQHRANGGTALVGGTTVLHSDTTPRTEAFTKQADEDGSRFHAKHGSYPLS